MKRLLGVALIFAIGVGVGCSLRENPVSATPFGPGTFPKTPPRIDERFVVTPCPKEWDGTPLCKWWDDYQKLEEWRYRRLVRLINSGQISAFEGIRGQ